jgi:hypothetical protein
MHINHDIKVATNTFVNAAKFKYLGTTVLNENYIHEQINDRLHPRNVY